MASAGILEHAAHAVVCVEHPAKLGGDNAALSRPLAQLLDGRKARAAPSGLSR